MTTIIAEVRARDWRAVSRRQLFWPLVILAALMLFNLPFTPNFFSVGVRHGNLYGSLVNILSFGAKTILVALGMTLVIATGGIDLSVGAVMAIAGAVACRIIVDAPNQNAASTVALAVALALLAGLAAGVFNGVMVARAGVQPIIATLVLMVAGRGIAQLITNGEVLTELSDPFGRIGGFTGGIPTDVFIVAGFVAVATVLTRRTALGLLVESVGGNAEAARLAGVRSRRIKLLVYVFCALCAATAGLIDASNLPGADANHSGLWIELDAILAVVIGGTPLTGGRFSLGGTVVGALILQTLKTTIFTIGIPSQANMVFEAAVVIVICLLQSAEFRARTSRLFARRPPPSQTPVVPAEPGIPGGDPVSTSDSASVGRIKAARLGTSTSARRILRDRRLPVAVTAVLLVAMYQYGSFRYSFDGQVAPNLLINNSYLIVAAVGATFVILTGGIDLSIGSLVGFSTVLTGVLVTDHHVPFALAAVVVLAVGAFGGYLMGCMVHYFRVQPFIATLAGLFLFRGLSQVLSKESIPIDAASVERLAQFHVPLPGGTFLSLGAAVALTVVAAAAVVLHLTKFGRRVYAIGGNEQSALLMGLPVARAKIGVYAVSGFCSALAGLVLVLYKQSGDPLSSIGLELDAIAAVVIGGALLTGGVGYVVGSLLGVLVIGLIKTIISLEGTLSSWWIKIVTGLLLLVFILLQRLAARSPD